MPRLKLFLMTLCLSAIATPTMARPLHTPTGSTPTASTTVKEHIVDTADLSSDFRAAFPSEHSSRRCIEIPETPVDVSDLLENAQPPIAPPTVPSTEPPVAVEVPIPSEEGAEYPEEAPSPAIEEPSDPLAEQVRLLEARQQTLEQEIEQLRSQIEFQNAQTDEPQTGENTPDEVIAQPLEEENDDPMGLDVSVALSTFDPTTGLLDFATIGSGSTFAVDSDIATVDYSSNEAIRYGANIRFADSPLDVGFSTISASAEGSASASVPPGGILFSTLSNPSQNEFAETASAEASLDYSVTDLQVGYRFDMGSSANTRLYGGLRFADISQDLLVRYDGEDFNNGEVSAAQSFSGIGLQVGSETELELGSGFSLFGQVGGALMIGDANFSQRETDNDGLDVIASLSQSSRAQIVPMLDLSAGVNWTGEMSEDSRIDLTFGYAVEHWFNVLNGVRSLDSSGSGALIQDETDLSSRGLFVELGLEFDF